MGIVKPAGYYSKDEARQVLNLSETTINKFINEGKIKSYNDGFRRWLDQTSVDAYAKELEERKKIAQIPTYKQFKREDWKPEPRENYYDLQDLCKMLGLTKVYTVNIINSSEFKFTKYYTKIKKIYYVKKEIDENLLKEIHKMNFTKKSKLWKLTNE